LWLDLLRLAASNMKYDEISNECRKNELREWNLGDCRKPQLNIWQIPSSPVILIKKL
jgi:hypothetical protein